MTGRKLAAAEFDVERIMELAAEQASRTGPVHAEIVGEEAERKPLWHLLEIFSQHENIAAAHLSARGFGVYLPTFRVKSVDSYGRKCWRTRKLFPGYLMLFDWDIMRHKLRIESCPGIAKIVHAAGRPAVVPDEMIGWMLAQEVIHDEALAIAIGGKRRRGRRREKLDDSMPAGVDMVIRSKRYRFDHLDDDGRNLVLRKALGL